MRDNLNSHGGACRRPFRHDIHHLVRPGGMCILLAPSITAFSPIQPMNWVLTTVQETGKMNAYILDKLGYILW